MIAKLVKSEQDLLNIIQGLVNQLQGAECEVIALRKERDMALNKLAELTIELNRALDVVIRLQAGAKS